MCSLKPLKLKVMPTSLARSTHTRAGSDGDAASAAHTLAASVEKDIPLRCRREDKNRRSVRLVGARVRCCRTRCEAQVVSMSWRDGGRRQLAEPGGRIRMPAWESRSAAGRV